MPTIESLERKNLRKTSLTGLISLNVSISLTCISASTSSDAILSASVSLSVSFIFSVSSIISISFSSINQSPSLTLGSTTEYMISEKSVPKTVKIAKNML